ncbi:hypothetical protein [Propionivibrio soli]|uniref:hypothetical protein n=1 Tax=Propionivibrio soli TaxID=2976531 RepID=UPI0021E8DE96|nr:hypothetical protein [Propionivibrio soli]
MSAWSIWTIVAIAGVLVVLLISGLFQPSHLSITYDADSFFQVRKLFFAAGVLAVLAFILLLCVAIYASLSTQNPANPAGKDIFDTMVKVIPPIMTLVLGYYFGQQSVVQSTLNQPSTVQAKDITKDQGSTQQKGGVSSSPPAPEATVSPASK